MRTEAPEPLPIDWIKKPVESARSGVDVLPDGRIHCWIEHDTIRGVTPQMLAWWFRHLEGTVEVDGVKFTRYKVWHPVDHVAVEYAKKLPDGSVGPGAVLHITEMFGGRPEYLVDVFSEIKKLDETGFEHHPRLHGLNAVVMSYEFEPAADGTRYVNSLTVGFRGVLGKVLNPLIRRFMFDPERGAAWVKHNIEEVGNFELFLPRLYAAETAV